MKNVWREVPAGIVGFVVFTGACVMLFYFSGYDPHAGVSRSFQVISIVCGVIFALASGYITAMISPASPMRPAIIVALLISVSAILSMLTSGSAEMWSQLATVLLMAPSVVIGARLRRDHSVRNSVTGEKE
jgi:hypothetical protein